MTYKIEKNQTNYQPLVAHRGHIVEKREGMQGRGKQTRLGWENRVKW